MWLGLGAQVPVTHSQAHMGALGPFVGQLVSQGLACCPIRSRIKVNELWVNNGAQKSPTCVKKQRL